MNLLKLVENLDLEKPFKKTADYFILIFQKAKKIKMKFQDRNIGQNPV